MSTQLIGNILSIIGLIIGLGAVTVIDIHGLLGQKSGYWTRATITAHKITKPLIWLGTVVFILGRLILNTVSEENLTQIQWVQSIILAPMVINGLFLSFYVSPYLLKQEKLGKMEEILPVNLQKKILISFIFSIISWWGSALLLIFEITKY